MRHLHITFERIAPPDAPELPTGNLAQNLLDVGRLIFGLLFLGLILAVPFLVTFLFFL